VYGVLHGLPAHRLHLHREHGAATPAAGTAPGTGSATTGLVFRTAAEGAGQEQDRRADDRRSCHGFPISVSG